MIRFVWAHRAWALAIPPLLFVGVAIHVEAWIAATQLAGGRVLEWHVLPRRVVGMVYFGDFCSVGASPILQALAPTVTWLLIAAAGILAHALWGHTRWPFVNRLLLIVTLVLPLVAIVMELSCIYAGRGFDGSNLYAHRNLVSVVVLPLVTCFIVAGWFRFRASFSQSLSPRQYAVGWTLVLALAALIRHSAMAWALIGVFTSAFPAVRSPTELSLQRAGWPADGWWSSPLALWSEQGSPRQRSLIQTWFVWDPARAKELLDRHGHVICDDCVVVRVDGRGRYLIGLSRNLGACVAACDRPFTLDGDCTPVRCGVIRQVQRRFSGLLRRCRGRGL
jgi:hypothetical protein